MTVAARRSSIVARSSAARRFAAVERLRRALFSPSKLLAVGALALALSAQSAFAQGTSNTVISPGETFNIGDVLIHQTVVGSDGQQTDILVEPRITLDGGTLRLDVMFELEKQGALKFGNVDTQWYYAINDSWGTDTWEWGANGGTFEVQTFYLKYKYDENGQMILKDKREDFGVDARVVSFHKFQGGSLDADAYNKLEDKLKPYYIQTSNGYECVLNRNEFSAEEYYVLDESVKALYKRVEDNQTSVYRFILSADEGATLTTDEFGELPEGFERFYEPVNGKTNDGLEICVEYKRKQTLENALTEKEFGDLANTALENFYVTKYATLEKDDNGEVKRYNVADYKKAPDRFYAPYSDSLDSQSNSILYVCSQITRDEAEAIRKLKKVEEEGDSSAGVASSLRKTGDGTLRLVNDSEGATWIPDLQIYGGAVELQELKTIVVNGDVKELEESQGVNFIGTVTLKKSEDTETLPLLIVDGKAALTETGNITNENGAVVFKDTLTLESPTAYNPKAPQYATYWSTSKDNSYRYHENLNAFADYFLNGVNIGSFGQLVSSDAVVYGELVVGSLGFAMLYGESRLADEAMAKEANLNEGSVKIEAGGLLLAHAACLDTPDAGGIQIDEGGLLVFYNLNDNAIQTAVKPIRDANGNETLEIYTAFEEGYDARSETGWFTYDEKDDKTWLSGNNAYRRMTEMVNSSKNFNALKDEVHEGAISGKGEIIIDASGFISAKNQETGKGDTLDLVARPDHLVVFGGDKSGFEGNTTVRLGSLALLSTSFWEAAEFNQRFSGEDHSKPIQVYGSDELTGEFVVKGEQLGLRRGNDVLDAGTNGRLIFWRDSNVAKTIDAAKLGDEELQELCDEITKRSVEITTGRFFAPTLNAGRVVFEGYYKEYGDKTQRHDAANQRGAQIVFNTAIQYQDFERDNDGKIKRDENGAPTLTQLVTDRASARCLATINANEIVFSQSNDIWYDGVSLLDPTAEMSVVLNAPSISVMGENNESQVVTYKFEQSGSNSAVQTLDLSAAAPAQYNEYTSTASEEFTQEDYETVLEGLFAKPLVRADARRNEEGNGYTMVMNAVDVKTYAEGQNMSAKERELAGKIDEARVQDGKSTEFYDALYNETDGENVRQTIHNLSLLGYTMLNSQGHFGNPTSSFFGGASISGGAKRGQERQEDWETEENQPEQKSEIAKERNDYNPTRGLWAAYTHTSVDGEDYKFGGVTTHGYKLRRNGIIGGIRRQIDATTSAGLFFGISMPEVASGAKLNAGDDIDGNGYGVVSSSMEMTDFQYAVHFEKVFADAWELAAYVGGGTQAMEWERRADLHDSHSGMYKYTADGSGSTFTGTLYLSYRADVNDALTLRPTIGVDTEHSWLYGFEEKGEELEKPSSVAHNPYTDMFAQAYRYKKTYYARNTARVGLSLAYSNPRNDMLGANARVFYGVKLGGDDAPELTYYNENYRWENMASHEMGDGSLNVGGGGFMHLNPIKTLTATGDVNAIWYKNAQTFNVTGGVSYRF